MWMRLLHGTGTRAFMPRPGQRNMDVLCIAAGATALLIADRVAMSKEATLAIVVAGVASFAAGASMATLRHARRRHARYFPDEPPRSEFPSNFAEGFACLTPGGPKVEDEGVSSADSIAAMLNEGTRVVTTPYKGRCGASFWSDPPEDSPAALAFDGLLLRAMYVDLKIPPLETVQIEVCPDDVPSESQLKEYIEAAVGREAVLPSVGTYVPTLVPCLLVRGCRTLRPVGETDERKDRALMHVEFLALREGDTHAVHYEAHIVTLPMAVVWFKRIGKVTSGDANCGRVRRRTP